MKTGSGYAESFRSKILHLVRLLHLNMRYATTVCNLKIHVAHHFLGSSGYFSANKILFAIAGIFQKRNLTRQTHWSGAIKVLGLQNEWSHWKMATKGRAGAV